MRAGYSAAIDRERYGRGGGGLNRYGEPNRPTMPQGAPRPPQQAPRGPLRRDDRPTQPVRAERPARSEEWSEVPPEIEELLRAQMAGRIQRPLQQRPAPGHVTAPRSDEESPVAELEEAGAGPVAEASGAETLKDPGRLLVDLLQLGLGDPQANGLLFQQATIIGSHVQPFSQAAATINARATPQPIISFSTAPL